MINKEEIKKLAFLSRLKLDNEEEENTPAELEAILKYIQKLSDINTTDIEPLFHFPELKNVVRDDVGIITDKEVKQKMMEMGKDKDNYLRVEAIL